MASGDGHRKANKAGKWLENEVENTINNCGLPSLFYKQIGTRFGKKVMTKYPYGFLLKNVPYTNMFGSTSRGEFVLQLSSLGPIRIECRNQTVRGSVDEKLPYLIGNCSCFEEKNVVLVIEGNGAREAAKRFVKNAARAIPHKNVKVLTLNQFKAWAKRTIKTKEKEN